MNQSSSELSSRSKSPRNWIRNRFRSRQLGPLEVTSLGDVLDRLELAQKDGEVVRFEALLEAMGRRSFGPMLLVPGLLVLSPVSGIPGVPTLCGAIVFLIAVQLLIGRKYFWLPGWILNRGISYKVFKRSLAVLRPVGRVVDKVLRQRLVWVAESAGVHVVATACVFVAVTMPPLELLPFAATAAGVAITAFGLALIGRDGLLGIIALIFCAVCFMLVGKAILALPV